LQQSIFFTLTPTLVIKLNVQASSSLGPRRRHRGWRVLQTQIRHHKRVVEVCPELSRRVLFEVPLHRPNHLAASRQPRSRGRRRHLRHLMLRSVVEHLVIKQVEVCRPVEVPQTAHIRLHVQKWEGSSAHVSNYYSTCMATEHMSLKRWMTCMHIEQAWRYLGGAEVSRVVVAISDVSKAEEIIHAPAGDSFREKLSDAASAQQARGSRRVADILLCHDPCLLRAALWPARYTVEVPLPSLNPCRVSSVVRLWSKLRLALSHGGGGLRVHSGGAVTKVRTIVAISSPAARRSRRLVLRHLVLRELSVLFQRGSEVRRLLGHGLRHLRHRDSLQRDANPGQQKALVVGRESIHRMNRQVTVPAQQRPILQAEIVPGLLLCNTTVR
jgi:hypothetical protein